MRIKKKTSALLIAASAAAAVGVSAVTFAAWQGNNTERAAKAETGYAYLFGFTTEQAAGEKLELGTLVPYNQDESTIKADENGVEGVKFVSVALPEYEVVGNYSIEVEYVANTSNLDFYVLVGSEVTAVPTGWDTTANVGDWQQVSAGASFDFTSDAATVNSDGNKTVFVSLMLVSDKADQMGKTADFNITLVNA